MRKRKDITGMRFGRLVVIRAMKDYITPGGQTMARWECLCDCGNKRAVLGTHLRGNKTWSCGCLRDEISRIKSVTHGEKSGGKMTGTYSSWRAMITRCTNPRQISARYYVLRGIKVCKRWRESFQDFKNDMGPRPSGMCIERINNDGNYEPGNCRWATPKDQANNSRHNRYISKDSIRLTISQWAQRLGVSSQLIYGRIHRGIDPQMALSMPLKSKYSKRKIQSTSEQLVFTT